MLLAFDKQDPEENEASAGHAADAPRRRAAGRRRRAPDGRGDLRPRLRSRRGRPGAGGVELPPGDHDGAPPRRRAHQPGTHPARARRSDRRRGALPARAGDPPQRSPPRASTSASSLEDGGHHAEALEAYQRAIAADDRNADAHYNAARLYDLLGDYALGAAPPADLSGPRPQAALKTEPGRLPGPGSSVTFAANAGESLRAFVPIDPRRRRRPRRA